MQIDQISAVLVTFHPDRDVLENLAAVRPQAGHLIVVDNGSSPEELALLRSAAATLGFDLIENADNLGIATALNQGVRHALARGAEWILFFDQDSRVTPGFTEAMLHCFTASPCGDRLGTLVPRYVDMRHHDPIPADRLPSGALDAAMTSGSLFSAATFQRHGLFLDDLFIDCVDSEYSLRLRRAGLLIAECPDAVLLHSPGAPQHHRLFGKTLFQTNNYSPLRRYYQERNRIWLTRRYFRSFPRYCFRLTLYSVKDAVKILLIEQDKRRKLAFFFRGLRDGLRGRLGKL